MDKHERRMLLRREKIRQDQLELRGKRHRAARERINHLANVEYERYIVMALRDLHPNHNWIIIPFQSGDHVTRIIGELIGDLPKLLQNIPYDHLQIWRNLKLTRDQILETWKKRMTIRSCRAIKEELMMNRWHPDRVRELLELGILDDLD
jgi:hypothetical protein